MTYREVYEMLSGITIGDRAVPFAYYMFPADDPNNPLPPFGVYYYSDSNDLEADNTNFQRIRALTVELYTDNKDFAAEEAVESALNAAGLVYARTETYLDAEKMYMVTYTTDIIVTEENNG